MNKSKSYAEITTPNENKTAVNDWPDLKSHQKINPKETDKSTGSISCQLNTITNAMERLSTDEKEQSNGEATVQKSRDDIRADRQQRRKNKSREKSEKLFQEKLDKIREPKSQKVQVVDKSVMETYLTSRKVSPIRNRRQGKSKSHCAVAIDLLDLINAEVVKPIHRSSIQSKPIAKFKSGTQCHKGKKREGRKRKYVSKLKRSILLSRLLRNQLKTQVKVMANGEDVDLKEPQFSDKESSTATTNDKLNNLPTNEPSGVKFSRKFRS